MIRSPVRKFLETTAGLIFCYIVRSIQDKAGLWVRRHLIQAAGLDWPCPSSGPRSLPIEDFVLDELSHEAVHDRVADDGSVMCGALHLAFLFTLADSDVVAAGSGKVSLALLHLGGNVCHLFGRKGRVLAIEVIKSRKKTKWGV